MFWHTTMCTIFAFIIFQLSFRLVTSQNDAFEKNSQNPEKHLRSKEENPFRTSKLNLFWQKAQKVVQKDLLDDLYYEFVAQDKREVDLKKKKLEKSYDREGEDEAAVREKFIRILKKFNLYDKTEDNHANEDNELHGSRKFDPRKLDKRLYKVWKRASQAGFSEMEMADLEKELQHYERKVEELEALRKAIDSIPVDNSVSQFKDEKEESEKKRKEKLQHKYKKLKEELLNLEKLAADPERASSTGGFQDPRVRELWATARASDLSQEELVSLRQELTHFERKLGKLKFYEEDLEKRKMLATDGNSDQHKDFQKAEKKLADYSKMVKKTQTDIKMRYLEKGEL